MLEDFQEKHDNKELMITYLHTLTITADSLEELNLKFDILFARLKELEVEVVKAVADRIYLFYKSRLTEILDNKRNHFFNMEVYVDFVKI